MKGLALLINFHIWIFSIGPKLDFWRIFENFGFAVLVLKWPTFSVFWDFENLTFPTFIAAVTTFQLAQQVHTIVSIEDIKGVWESVIWSQVMDK